MMRAETQIEESCRKLLNTYGHDDVLSLAR